MIALQRGIPGELLLFLFPGIIKGLDLLRIKIPQALVLRLGAARFLLHTLQIRILQLRLQIREALFGVLQLFGQGILLPKLPFSLAFPVAQL